MGEDGGHSEDEVGVDDVRLEALSVGKHLRKY